MYYIIYMIFGLPLGINQLLLYDTVSGSLSLKGLSLTYIGISKTEET